MSNAQGKEAVAVVVPDDVVVPDVVVENGDDDQ